MQVSTNGMILFPVPILLMATLVTDGLAFRNTETNVCTCLQWPQSLEEYFCLGDYAYVGRVVASRQVNHEPLLNDDGSPSPSTSNDPFAHAVYTIRIEEILSGIPDKLQGARIEVNIPLPGQVCGMEQLLHDVYLIQGFGNFREADLCDMFQKYDTVPRTFKDFLTSEQTEILCEDFLSSFSSYNY